MDSLIRETDGCPLFTFRGLKKMTEMSNKTKKRLIVTFLVVGALLLALLFRLGWVMVVNGETYSKKAVTQQTKDVEIEAKRGDILDRNGKELAVSAAVYTVWARPSTVRNIKNGTEDEIEAKVYTTATKLAEVLAMDVEEVKTLINNTEKTLVKVAKYVDKEKADTIRELGLSGIELSEEVKRYYPNGAFASQVLGSVSDDNNGLAGLELKYNNYLKGVSGRWVKNTDVHGNQLSYGVEKYYAAEDGYTVVTTLDEVIQHYAQKAIETVQENTAADRVMCIVMDPKTGDVLAMAMTPTYDPNNPRVPLDEEEAAAFAEMDSNGQIEYLYKMWRNPMVSDVYEPGSTSKLMTTAIALEEGLTSLNETFVCKGYFTVADRTLRCWRYYQPHGTETLVQAVQNSCNPVFATLAARIGIEKFYEYMELFGMTEKTGIDYPGEAESILQNINTAGPVGLATMSYGQGIAVTMIQQLTAICSLGNGGKLMQPRMVKELRDSDGNVVKTFDTKVVRQVVSAETASEMCMIMESVVSEGGGGNAKVLGYRVGGKTGTANKPSANGGYSNETYSSFIGMAPMDDPKVALLVVVDNPKGTKYGSTTAAPGAQQILSDTLRYLNVQPEYTQEELAQINNQRTVVPEATNINVSEAIGKLAGAQLNYVISPAYDGTDDFIVVDQYPKAGEKVETGSTVYLYRE